MAISENTEGHGLVLTWGNTNLDYNTFTHIKLFPSIRNFIGFFQSNVYLLKKRVFQSGLWSPSVACAGTHHSWQENIARYTELQHSQPRGCAATVPAAHLPPAWLWRGVLRGNSPPSQTELGPIKAALLPQNNESPLRNTLMRNKFLSDKIRDDPMMSYSFQLLLPSGRR